MKEFKYFDSFYFFKLIIGTLIACVGFSILVHKFDHVLDKRIFIPAIFLVSIAFVYLNRKKVTRTGRAWVDKSSVTFDTPKLQETIQFRDILKYKIEWYQGVTLKLWLQDGRKIFFQANDNFHCSDQLASICTSLMNNINSFNQDAPVKIERKKSMLEEKWVYPALIIFTVLVVIMIVHAIITGKKVGGSFFIGLSSLAMLWGGYWSTKSNLHSKF